MEDWAHLYFGNFRVSLYLVDLFGVGVAVRGDEEHPLVAVELFAEWAIDRVLAQNLRVF